MKWLHLLSVVACVTDEAYAFPSHLHGAVGHLTASRLSSVVDEAVRSAHEKRLLFDAGNEPIDVTGKHEFIPPDFEKGDQRGPCPGLNALANHGYINRNGVTSLVETIGAINKVYGMGIDLATILATMGVVFVGNPLSLNPGFSIGSTAKAKGTDNILGNLVGLLGKPRGLVGSHNIIEGDSSNTRADLYVTGDASTMVMDQFQSFYDMASDEEGTYDFDTFAERAKIRFRETIATNPDFYYGPFTGMIARNAGYFFACRMLSNHTKGSHEDIMDRATLRSFFAVQKEGDKLTYKRGWERIPTNWYRRSVDYGLIDLNLDVISLITKYPELGSIGGNMGEVNSYAGVDVSDITGGVLNLTKLLKGNNLLCFVFEVVKTVSPNSLSGLFSIVAPPLKLITDALGTALLDLPCPAFKDLQVGGESFSKGIQKKFPGAKINASL
ncbi:Chloroperoxidase [Fusarium flagelliforme]|uniref:Chloroperoxidase n=1 Tax=Fusarium flagelliforme TaxID=2675880 RepID=UPI001E8EBAA2|nr:Chloroperoxidase [Fusarium flagelliforme]KAH7180040.1 Chloroperoxidase [Fusarium flagelliforme]